MNGILLAIGKLLGLTLAGFLIFKIRYLQQKVLKPLLFITLNFLFPFYFIHRFPAGWAAAIKYGWHWMAIFFGISLIMLLLQLAAGKALVKYFPGMKTDNPQALLVFFAVHNAGYIPLPILAAFAPDSFMVFMFFYVFAFNVFFWIVVVSILSNRKKFQIKLNAPLLGILLGILLALLNSRWGVYDNFPWIIRRSFSFLGDRSLDFILICLGGILAGIRKENIRFRKEFVWTFIFRMLLYPTLFLITGVLIPLGSLDPEIAFCIRVALVLEGAVPPATNIMVVAKKYSSEEDVQYLGGGILLLYAAAIITLPLFLALAVWLFR